MLSHRYPLIPAILALVFTIGCTKITNNNEIIVDNTIRSGLNRILLTNYSNNVRCIKISDKDGNVLLEANVPVLTHYPQLWRTFNADLNGNDIVVFIEGESKDIHIPKDTIDIIINSSLSIKDAKAVELHNKHTEWD